MTAEAKAAYNKIALEFVKKDIVSLAVGCG